MRQLAALALFFAASPAAADYVYDPADLPTGFQCDTGPEAEPCDRQRRYEAWWNRYGDAYDGWFHELTENTDYFFADFGFGREGWDGDGEAGSPANGRLGHTTPNLVDAVYAVALRRFGGGWSFAVDIVCPAASPDDCSPKLRMVRPRRRDEVDQATQDSVLGFLPTSRSEVASDLRISMAWEEADLRTCPGAVRHLLDFPGRERDEIWGRRLIEQIRGEEPRPSRDTSSDVIIVTADGDSVFMRAGSNPTLIYDQWNGGDGYDWVLRMAEIVMPCLEPATEPAPWDKIVGALEARVD